MTMITFGEKLRYLRRKNNLTQKQLGIAVGFPETLALKYAYEMAIPILANNKTPTIDKIIIFLSFIHITSFLLF